MGTYWGLWAYCGRTVMFNIAHAELDSKLIASEKAGLYGWHKDRGSICQGQY